MYRRMFVFYCRFIKLIDFDATLIKKLQLFLQITGKDCSKKDFLLQKCLKKKQKKQQQIKVVICLLFLFFL